MDHLVTLIFAGFLIGAFGTLIGAGGGFLLVPLLILTQPAMPPEIVTAISIAVVAVNAISGSVAYARAGRIDYKAGLLFGAFTIPGSVIGVYLVKYIPLPIFNIIFGCLLLLISIYLFIKGGERDIKDSPTSHKLENNKYTLTDKNGETYYYAYNKTIGIIISILVGFISPILGIGGGIIHVPAMVQWLQFPVHIATATSHFVLAIMASISVIIHFIEGSYSNPATQKILLGLCIGVIPGAQLGAYISGKIKTNLIIKILAICLGLVGLRILL